MRVKHANVNSIHITDTTVSLEELYQAFKERLIDEVVAREQYVERCSLCGRDPNDHMSGCPNGPAR